MNRSEKIYLILIAVLILIFIYLVITVARGEASANGQYRSFVPAVLSGGSRAANLSEPYPPPGTPAPPRPTPTWAPTACGHDLNMCPPTETPITIIIYPNNTPTPRP